MKKPRAQKSQHTTIVVSRQFNKTNIGFPTPLILKTFKNYTGEMYERKKGKIAGTKRSISVKEK